MKFIRKSKVTTEWWVETPDHRRLPSEVYLLRSLDHPNIVKVLLYNEISLKFFVIICASDVVRRRRYCDQFVTIIIIIIIIRAFVRRTMCAVCG